MNKKKQTSKSKSAASRAKAKNPSVNKIQGSYLNYDAAQYSTNRTYVFAPLYDDAKNELDTSSRYRLLLISRQLENNFSVYKQLVDTVSRFGVGRGIIPAPATSNATFNDQAENAFYLWSDNRFCTVDQSGTYWDVLRLCAERLVVDGEFFCLFTKSINGYPQLQLIDPLKVVQDISDPSDIQPNGNRMVDGILYNSKGQPLNYRVKLDNDTFVNVTPENVVHVFDRKRIGQGRGFPWATSAFNEMQDVKDTLSLELQAAKISSIFAGQLVDTNGEGGPDDSSALLAPRGKQPLPQANGKNVPNNVNPSEVEQVIKGGRILDLKNKKLEMLESNRPGPAFKSLRDMLHRDICLSVGLPFEVAYDPSLINNPSNSIVTENARSFFAEVQEILVNCFCQRVYAWVISNQLPLEDIRPLGNENPFNVTWIYPKKFGIQRSDINNYVDAINNKMCTLQKFYAECYGEDWKPNVVQRISEEAFINMNAKQQGVDMEQVIYGKGTVSSKNQDNANVPEQPTNDDNEKEK